MVSDQSNPIHTQYDSGEKQMNGQRKRLHLSVHFRIDDDVFLVVFWSLKEIRDLRNS